MNSLFLAESAWRAHIAPTVPRKPHSVWQLRLLLFELGGGLFFSHSGYTLKYQQGYFTSSLYFGFQAFTVYDISLFFSSRSLQDRTLFHPVSNSCMDCSPAEKKIFMARCDPLSETQQWIFEHINMTVLEKFNYHASS